LSEAKDCEFGDDLLGGAGEEGIWEVLGGRGGYWGGVANMDSATSM